MTTPRGTGAIRLLARTLPKFRGRDFALWQLARALNRSWPTAASYESARGLRFTLDLTDPGHRMIFLLARFEDDLLWVIDSLLQPGDGVVEAGTNIGLYTTIIAQRVAPAGVVLGFEPLDRARARAAEHLERNRLTNVRLLPVALGEAPGSARIYSFDSLPIGHASLANLDPASSVGAECVVTTIDEQVGAHDLANVRLIKLDVEGSEFAALRGAAATIARWRPLLIVEANSETARAFGYAPPAIVEWLAGRDYSCYVRRRKRWQRLDDPALLLESENMLFVHRTDAKAHARLRDG